MFLVHFDQNRGKNKIYPQFYNILWAIKVDCTWHLHFFGNLQGQEYLVRMYIYDIFAPNQL